MFSILKLAFIFALALFVIAPDFLKNGHMSWLTEDLKKEIRKTFEPRYRRKLTDNEVVAIAENLTGSMETILRFKCENKYGEQHL